MSRFLCAAAEFYGKQNEHKRIKNSCTGKVFHRKKETEVQNIFIQKSKERRNDDSNKHKNEHKVVKKRSSETDR